MGFSTPHAWWGRRDGKGPSGRAHTLPGPPRVQSPARDPAAAHPKGWDPSPGPGPPALRGAGGRNNSARGRGGGGGGALLRAPPPARPPRSHTRSHTGSHPPPAQALPAGAAAAAAAPAMDVRLYPSAPAVGARPGAEPAGLAHLDYYHCGKVGGGRGWAPRRARPARAFGPRAAAGASRAGVRGRNHLAAGDGALSETHGGRCRGANVRGPSRTSPADGHMPLT